MVVTVSNKIRSVFYLSCLMLVCLVLTHISLGQARQTAPPVSYERDVAPLLAMHCNSCHSSPTDWWPGGTAGGFNATSYSTLMKGGQRGPAIIPGRPEQSLLIQSVIDGGPIRIKMPFDGPPLSKEQINVLKTWVAQGAKDDKAELPEHLIEIPDVPTTDKSISVLCRVLEAAYLVIDVVNPANGNTIEQRVASARPGFWTEWKLTASAAWPREVTLRLHVKYADPELTGTVFYVDAVRTDSRDKGSLNFASFLPDPVAPPDQPTGLFKYWLDTACDVTINVLGDGARQPLLTLTSPDMDRGARYYRWNLRTRDGQWVPPGRYYARFRFKPRKAGAYQPDLAIEFTIGRPGN